MGSTRRAFRQGFTLIELLVVIAIIAILAAILFPVFAQAREKARQTSCLSNQKQLATAAMMYLQDYDEVFHRLGGSWVIGNPPANGPQWGYGAECCLRPYIKNQQLWKCPSDSITRRYTGGSPALPISYAWTHFRSNDGSNGLAAFGLCAYYTDSNSKAMAEVGAPADTVMMFELWNGKAYIASQGSPNGDWLYNMQQAGIDPTGGTPVVPSCPQKMTVPFPELGGTADQCIGVHSGMTNVSFADGHAKTIRREQLMPFPWTAAWIASRTNNRNLLHWNAQYK
jgi:prepilin-type N-terminal cleavage/methylation domain-containing protein/prepilin-type processing-associated H-X9-DG protein